MKIAIFVGAMLLALQGTTLAYEIETNDIKLVDDGGVSSLTTRATTVEELLYLNGIELHEKDIISTDLEDEISTGDTITIDRGFDLSVIAGTDTPLLVKVSVGETVNEIIAFATERTGNYYTYDGDATRKVVKNDLIRLTQIDEEIFYTEEIINFQTEVIYTDELLFGEEIMSREGEYGIRSIANLVIFENGEEVSNDIINVTIVREPVNAIRKVGTRRMVSTSTGNFAYSRSLIMNATAYSAEQPLLSNYTATGIRAVKGVVAVDPRVIPLGTNLYIPGYGHALAADTGRDIIGNRIDLCFNTVREAIEFGRRNIKVYILE